MRNGTKKAGVVAVCLALVLALVAACSNANNTSGKPPGTGTTAPETNTSETGTGTTESGNYFPLKQPIEVKAMILDFGRSRDLRTDQELEKRTNIKFNWDLVPGADIATKPNIVMASGNIPDLMIFTRPVFEQYQNSGSFVDFAQYLDKMPNLSKYIEKFPDIANFPKTAEGNIYAINNFYVEGNLPVGYLYRKDIYDQHGIALPTTFGELYDGLKKLRAAYPDVYPLVVPNGHVPSYMYRAYHTSDTIYFDLDALEYKYGPATQNFVDSLNFTRKLYEEGLIDAEFPVTDPEMAKQKIITGKGFMTIDYIESLTRFNEEGQASDPAYHMVAALPPVTDTGLQARVQVTMPSSNYWYTAVSSKSKYVDEIVQFLDFQFSEEITDLVNWGFEGETFVKRADGTNEFTADVKTKTNPNGTIVLSELGVDSRTGFWPIYDYRAIYAANHPEETVASLYEYIDHAEQIGEFPGPNIKLPKDMDEERIRVMESVNTRVKEAAINYVTGKIDAAALQNIIGELEQQGDYKKYVDYYNAEFANIKGTYQLNTAIK